jgi:hypothetical protein
VIAIVYGASNRISTSFGSVATTEDGILYASAIDDWSSFDEEEAHPMERKHRFVLLLLVRLLLLLGDEVVASEDESTRRSDVRAVDM